MAEAVNPTERHRHTSSGHVFHCHGCGSGFPHKPGADLFCSEKCRKRQEKKVQQTAATLAAKGFKRSSKAPNVFTKDGVSITLEQVLTNGLKETIAAHAAVRR